jgi:CDP-glycerol glycerophosphotransferase (TagB/SpsB family)
LQVFWEKMWAVITKALSFVVYFLSGFMPRSERLWVYGSQIGTFSDNSRYLYLIGSREVPSIRHVWITWSPEVAQRLKKNGLEAYETSSVRGRWCCLRAGVCVFNHGITDISWSLLRGARRINLWHGLPLKKMGHDIVAFRVMPDAGSVTQISKFLSIWRDPHLLGIPPDMFLGASPLMKARFASAFCISESSVLLGGYPRLLPFSWSKEETLSHIQAFEDDDVQKMVHEFKKYSQVFVYMPTYRDGRPNFLSEALPSLEALNDVCQSRNILFVVKLHPYTAIPQSGYGYSNIYYASRSMDSYPLLALADCLVTDYSSILFDYAVTGRRVIFYPHDLTEYLKDRGLYDSYDDIAYDTVVDNFAQLLDVIKHGAYVRDDNKRVRLVSRYWGDQYKNIKGVFGAITNRLGIAERERRS